MKAEEALTQIAYLQELVTQTRLRATDGYPYFLLWGLLWLLGYLGSIWLPHYPLWHIITLAGGILTAVIGFTRKKGQPVPPLLKKLGWLGLILFLAASSLFALLLTLTRNPRLLSSYWPFQIGVIFLAAGVFLGRSMVLIGAWLVLAAVAGVWMPVPLQQIWLAAGGGGGLLFTGFWLRKRAREDG